MKPFKHNFLPEQAQNILKNAADAAKHIQGARERAKVLDDAITAVKVLYQRRFK